MQIGFIGLGRMGKEMVLHLLEGGVEVVVYNRTKQRIDELCAEFQISNFKFQINKVGKIYKAYSTEELVKQLKPPRIVWLMVPQGRPVDEMIGRLLGNSEVSREVHLGGVLARTPREKLTAIVGLSTGDILIDGGNSFYKDSIRRFEYLKKKGIHFLDVGTSGGLSGARNGACLMVGGDRSVFNEVQPRLEVMARPKGTVTYFGSTGAGHFVKMVHNGVEYGMLEALGEGFDILFNSPYQLDLEKVAKNWSKGSVVRGWLVELLKKALKKDPKLARFTGKVGGGETGEWTIKTAKELRVRASVLEDSVTARKKSLEKPNFSGKVISALRYQFGGHRD